MIYMDKLVIVIESGDNIKLTCTLKRTRFQRFIEIWDGTLVGRLSSGKGGQSSGRINIHLKPGTTISKSPTTPPPTPIDDEHNHQQNKILNNVPNVEEAEADDGESVVHTTAWLIWFLPPTPIIHNFYNHYIFLVLKT